MIKKLISKKRFLNFKDYFVDKKQAIKFKKWDGNDYLFTEGVVVLSNNQTTRNLELNINQYKNTIIIIKNSSFDELRIIEYNENNNKIILDKCIIKSLEITLTEQSDIEVIDSIVEDAIIYNGNIISFKCIKNEDLSVPLNIVVEKGKNININDVKGNIKMTLNGTNININNSNFLITEINAFIQLIITISKIRHQLLNSAGGIIYTKNLTLCGPSEISNCCINTYDMVVLEKSYLYIQNVYFDILNNLEIKECSYVEDNQYKASIIDSNCITIHSNSGIDIRGLEHSNNLKQTLNLNFNELKKERENLIKSLSLIRNKFNPQIKELE